MFRYGFTNEREARRDFVDDSFDNVGDTTDLTVIVFKVCFFSTMLPIDEWF